MAYQYNGKFVAIQVTMSAMYMPAYSHCVASIQTDDHQCTSVLYVCVVVL